MHRLIRSLLLIGSSERAPSPVILDTPWLFLSSAVPPHTRTLLSAPRRSRSPVVSFGLASLSGSYLCYLQFSSQCTCSWHGPKRSTSDPPPPVHVSPQHSLSMPVNLLLYPHPSFSFSLAALLLNHCLSVTSCLICRVSTFFCFAPLSVDAPSTYSSLPPARYILMLGLFPALFFQPLRCPLPHTSPPSPRGPSCFPSDDVTLSQAYDRLCVWPNSSPR